MITAMRYLPCEDKLKQCRLSTLETRRVRGEQTELFKIMHGFEDINKSNVLRLIEDIT